MGARPFSLPTPRLGSLPSARALRRWLVGLLIVAALAIAAFFLWIRDSSLVAVEAVRVTGAEEHPELVAKLESAADGMSTLAVDTEALRAAVADEPLVDSLSAEGVFPHRLEVTLDLREPAGYVPGSGEVVAGDGVIIDRTDEAPEGLPVIEAEADGGSSAGVGGEALAIAKVLGAAPPELLDGTLAAARVDAEHGVVADVGDGVELRFGDPGNADAKWRAATAVLADGQLIQAAYIDLRVPEHPVAGSG